MVMRYKEEHLALMRLCVGICTYDLRWQVHACTFHNLIGELSHTAGDPETELTVG